MVWVIPAFLPPSFAYFAVAAAAAASGGTLLPFSSAASFPSLIKKSLERSWHFPTEVRLGGGGGGGMAAFRVSSFISINLEI